MLLAGSILLIAVLAGVIAYLTLSVQSVQLEPASIEFH